MILVIKFLQKICKIFKNIKKEKKYKLIFRMKKSHKNKINFEKQKIISLLKNLNLEKLNNFSILCDKSINALKKKQKNYFCR